jgi:hypothetical protein
MLFGGGLVGMVNGVWGLRYHDRVADLVLGERNIEAWGWISLIGGVLLLTAGIGVFRGKRWARWTGIGLALLAILWNVGWAQIQPAQSTIGAFLYITVVYALATTPVTLDIAESDAT